MTIARMADTPKRSQPAKKPTKAKKPVARTKATGSGAPNAAPAKLEPRQQRFVDEYLVDMNATQAAVRAGYSAKTAQEQGSRLLSKAMVSEAIAAGAKKLSADTGVNAERALKEAWAIATADARELVQVRVGCCRHCYGEGYRFQRTVGEMNRDREAWANRGKAAEDFDEQGGIGYDPLRAPSPECPECGGDGHARTVLMDTRKLSPAAAALYAGAKQTKHGIEIQMHSKSDALEKVFKHLGLYKEDNAQRVDPLASLLHAIASGNSSGFRPVAQDPDHAGGGA